MSSPRSDRSNGRALSLLVVISQAACGPIDVGWKGPADSRSPDATTDFDTGLAAEDSGTDDGTTDPSTGSDGDTDTADSDVDSAQILPQKPNHLTDMQCTEWGLHSRWLRNGVPVDLASGAVSADQLVPGDQWTCEHRSAEGALQATRTVDIRTGFTEVDTSQTTSCGLRPAQVATDPGDILCWGGDESWHDGGRAGRFVDVAVSASMVCGLTEVGAVECWGDWSGTISGRFESLHSGVDDGICGLDAEGDATCWSRAGAPFSVVGPFDDVGVVVTGASVIQVCGLQASDGALRCASSAVPDAATDLTNPPGGEFRLVTGDSNTMCGVDYRGVLTCWGQYAGTRDMGVVAADSSHGSGCGLSGLGDLLCWGDLFGLDDDEVEAGRYQRVATSDHHGCAVGLYSYDLYCWGENHFGEAERPD